MQRYGTHVVKNSGKEEPFESLFLIKIYYMRRLIVLLALMLSLTGIALLVLAFLSSRVAVELAIVAAMLLAVWLVTALMRR